MAQKPNKKESYQLMLSSATVLFIILSLQNLQLVYAVDTKLPQDKNTLAISLPNGVSVQLIGVCSSPINGKQLWQPNGTPFEIEPYEGWSSPVAVKWAADKSPERKIYELALGITHGSTESVTTKWKFTKGDQACFDIGYSPRQNIKSVFIEDYTNAKEIDFKVAIAFGSWQTDCRYKKANQRSDFWGVDSTGYAIIWQHPMIPEKDYPGKTKLNVIHDFTDKYEARIMLSDIHSQIHNPVQTNSNWVKNLTILRCYFDEPINLVDEFLFQIRPLYWIQFKNVSLSSGYSTKPKVELCESVDDN